MTFQLQSQGTSAGDEQIAVLGPWFHNLHLPDGVQTAPDHPLGDFPLFKWRQLENALPQDLAGARVLDVGCNAGFYSFELARRGADVLAIDHDPHYLRQARWARERFGLTESVELRQLGVYDLARLEEQFDLVLFLGVLYHLRYPLLGLDLVAEKMRAGGRLVLQTLTLPGDDRLATPPDLTLDERVRLLEPGWPMMAFVEHRMAGDPTNWWLANASAVEAMLRSCGLHVLDRPAHEMWLCERRSGFPYGAELDRATGRAGEPPTERVG
jgi:tRNA (mo5U34)-methyltransferase